MNAHLFHTILGVLASLIASYVYATLSKTPLSLAQVVLFCAAVAVGSWVISKLRGRFRLACLSPIDSFYPEGQSQFSADLKRDLLRSHTVKVIGARGVDVIGERSPLGALLSEDKWTGTLEAFLLNPGSSHARLRVNHLDVEKEKYQADSQAVHKFLAVTAARNHVTVTIYEYDATPIFRAVILDDAAYISLYQDGVQGRLLPAFRLCSVRDPLYPALLTYCKHLRSTATARAYPIASSAPVAASK